MKTLLPALAAGLIFSMPVVMTMTARADDHGAPASVEELHEQQAVETTEVTLADGTKAVVEGGYVYVLDADGVKTPAPDGEHALLDGSVIMVKDGMLVAPDAEQQADEWLDPRETDVIDQ